MTWLLARSWVISGALEGTLARHAQEQALAPFLDPAPERIRALETNPTSLLGSHWEQEVSAGSVDVVSAPVGYVEELSERGAGDVEVLRAHDYVRYLRDLSGGQALRTLVHRHYDAPEAGLHFRRFPGAERIKPYEDDDRAALDHGRLDAAGQARVLIPETARAFELNRRMFANLAASTDLVGVGA